MNTRNYQWQRKAMGTTKSKLSREEIRSLRNATYFDKKELQCWYDDFMRDCPSGYLGEDEFVRMYQQFFPIGDPSQFATFIFKVFDQNSDGCISFREFIIALSITSRGTVTEKLQWAFSLYDLDRDGYITKAEMLAVMQSIYAITDNRNYREMCNLSADQNSLQERVDKIFIQMDVDQDGKLSIEEFCEGFKSDPWIIQTLAINIADMVEVSEGTSAK